MAMILGGAACDGCHHDVHGGRIESASPEDGCDSCHDARAFRPSTVDVARHQEFGYALEGAHRAVPCSDCHDGLNARAPSSSTLLGVDWSGPDLAFQEKHERCEDCHRTPHGEQFAHRADGSACEACHDLAAFRPAPRFDHRRDSRYPLTGAHLEVACKACHPAGEDGSPVFRPRPRTCAGCHGPGPLRQLQPAVNKAAAAARRQEHGS
jgi:hypothetical protein